VEWQKSYHPDHWYEHPHKELNPSIPSAYHPYTSHTQTGEDWMYKIQNWYDANGNKDGYLMTGYTTFQNKADRYADCDGNGFPEANVQRGINTDEHECDDPSNYHWKGSEHAAAMRIDDDGNVIWFKSYGEEYGEMWSCVQSEVDRNVAYLCGRGGTSNNMRYSYQDASTGNYVSTTLTNPNHCDYKLGFKNGRKPYLIKIDGNGDLLWDYTYGAQDPTVHPNADNYNLEGQFWDLAETDDGGIIAVGCVKQLVATGGSQFVGGKLQGFIVKVDANGNLLNSRILGVSADGDFGCFAIEKEHSSSFVVLFNAKGGVGTFKIDQNGNDLISNPFNVSNVFKAGDPMPSIQLSPFINFSKSSFGVDPSFKGWDLERVPVVGGPDKFVLGVAVMGTSHHIYHYLGSGNNGSNNEGILVLLNNDLSYNSQISMGEISAYDIKVGVKVLDDGSICGVSSTHRRQLIDEFIPWNFVASNCCPGASDIPASYTEPNNGTEFYGSDGIIINVPANMDSLNWSTLIIDPMDAGSCWPENVKKQLCMYALVEGENGDLMVCGNNGINFDDVHVVKMSNCYNNTSPATTYNWVPKYPNLLYTDEHYYKGTNEDILTSELFIGATSVTVGTNKIIKGRLIVEPGFDLTISWNAQWLFEPLQNSQDPQIIVKDGAKLTLDGVSSISSLFDSNPACLDIGWGGILVEDGGELKIKNSSIVSAYTGVRVLGNGKIEVLNDPGFTHIQNFENCYRGVDLIVSPIPIAYPTSGSSFKRAYFFNNKPLHFSNYGGNDLGQNNYTKGLDYMVKVQSYGNQLRFSSCKFENTETDAPFVHGTGVLAMNSGLDFIKGGHQTTAYPPGDEQCQVPDEAPNTFIGLNEGIFIGNNGSNNLRLRSLESEFFNCQNAINATACNNTLLYQNHVEWDNNFPNYTNMPTWDKAGLSLSWCSDSKVWENNIVNSDATKNFIGIWTGRSTNAVLSGLGADNFKNTVDNQTTNIFGIGEFILHDNSDMQLTCNTYKKLNTDWWVFELDPANNATLQDQGNGTFHNNNLWTDGALNPVHIRDEPSVLTNTPDWAYLMDFGLISTPEFPFIAEPAAINMSGGGTGVNCDEKDKCTIYGNLVDDDFDIMAIYLLQDELDDSTLISAVGDNVLNRSLPPTYSEAYHKLLDDSYLHSIDGQAAQISLWFDYAERRIKKYSLPETRNKTEDLEQHPNDALIAFHIIPNPSNGLFQVWSNSKSIQQVVVLNSMGQVVSKQQLDKGTKEYSIDLTAHTDGVYYVRFTDVEGYNEVKILIKK
jgi:hypothetical protein